MKIRIELIINLQERWSKLQLPMHWHFSRACFPCKLCIFKYSLHLISWLMFRRKFINHFNEKNIKNVSNLSQKALLIKHWNDSMPKRHCKCMTQKTASKWLCTKIIWRKRGCEIVRWNVYTKMQVSWLQDTLTLISTYYSYTAHWRL